MEVCAEGGDVSAVTPDTPPLFLPLVLVALGSGLCLDFTMMVHILTDLHIPGGSISLGPGVSVLLVPLQPSHEATDDGHGGLPTHVLGPGHWTWLWLWVWLWMRILQGLVDVRVLLLLMPMLRRFLDVRVVLGTLQWT